MRSSLIVATLAVTTFLGASAAEARGCIKGAIVGGIAGHLAGHGLAGAAAGCAVGSGASHYMRRHNTRTSLQNDQRAITPPAMAR